ncbi:DNA mismatch repair protein spel1 [Amblyomma americanum]
MAELLPNADISEVERDPGFLGFLRSLPEKPATTFRFFDRNDYYTVHGADAEYVCREVYRSMSALKYLGSGDAKVASVCVSQRSYESLLSELLLIKRYRVEVYQNKAARPFSAWALVTQASPGNLAPLEDVLFGSTGGGLSESKGVLAVSLHSNLQTLGVAYGDSVLQQLTVAEFVNDEHFSNLSAVLAQLSPQECLLSATDARRCPELKALLERSGALVTEAKPGDFNSKEIAQDLGCLLQPSQLPQGQASMLAELDLKVAMDALAAVIKYLNLTSSPEHLGCLRLCTFDFGQFVRLNTAAIKALGVLPADGDGSKSASEPSLLRLLNRCRTIGGQRMLSQWLRQPLCDLNRIEERLELVSLLVDDWELRQGLHDQLLRQFPDLLRLSRRLHRQRVSLQELYKMYQCLQTLPKLREALTKAAESRQSTLLTSLFATPLEGLEGDFSNYQEMVESTLDFEAVEQGDFLVKPEFDDELLALHEELEAVKVECGDYLKHVANDLCLEAGKTIKLESNKEMGYYFRVTRKEEPALRSCKNYTTIDTKQNGVRFRNEDLAATNVRFLEARAAYDRAQEGITKLIVEIAAGYWEPLQQLSEVISHLDVLVSFAVVAVSASGKPYVRPTMRPKGTGVIKMTALRHPLVEAQEDVLFIPNDVEMCKGSSSCYIITGPNMGGKSTYIRSVALAVLMAQVGSFVPCDSAELSLVDAVLTRIGAGDQQLKGVSTFMAEMLESSHILRNATADSLVVIDELGRGTSTYDGFGLAWAISEHLVKEVDAFCLFATHFHELTELADEVPCVRNVHVTADVREDSFTLLYKIKPGVCSQSFGLEVAQLARFPDHVIKEARQVLSQYEDTAAGNDAVSMEH